MAYNIHELTCKENLKNLVTEYYGFIIRILKNKFVVESNSTVQLNSILGCFTEEWQDDQINGN